MKGNHSMQFVSNNIILSYFSESLISWLSGLPQLLKKLGDTNLEASSLILDVLSHAASKNISSMVDCLVEQLFSKSVIFIIRC